MRILRFASFVGTNWNHRLDLEDETLVRLPQRRVNRVRGYSASEDEAQVARAFWRRCNGLAAVGSNLDVADIGDIHCIFEVAHAEKNTAPGDRDHHHTSSSVELRLRQWQV